MSKEFSQRELNFYQTIISEYLQTGSVDEIFRRHSYDLPISYPGVHRLISRWGIVKSVGPNSKLSEAITFLVLLSDRKIPLERLYRELPPSFQTSMATMHRILHCIKEGVVRRFGTALVITPHKREDLVLVGEDITPPKIKLGKPFGAITLPMTYSGRKEDPGVSILRVLQQEVFSRLAIEKRFPLNMIPAIPKPFMHLKIADIGVAVYHLPLTREFSEESVFSSFKVRHHQFASFEDISKLESGLVVRSGVKEIIEGYRKYLNQESVVIEEVSQINLALAGVVV